MMGRSPVPVADGVMVLTPNGEARRLETTLTEQTANRPNQVPDIVAPGRLRFAVLGPLRAWRDGVELDLGSPQQVATLALLLLGDGRPVSLSELVDGVWGTEPPPTAVSTLRTYISRLRRVLGADVVESVGPGYRLRFDPGSVDLHEFEDALATAESQRLTGHPEEAAAVLRSALDRWQGVPLPGIPGPFAELQRTRLGDPRLDAISERIDLDLAVGRHVEVATELTGLTAEYPLREHFREQLMLALYRSGRQAEALAVFEDTRHVLAEELGIDPGAGLLELHQ